MSRVNFFQLLELRINPPESDPRAIASAIKRKQAEWSRMRNHPTKGTQARQYISLLTEIRKVMEDAELREKEAQQALELLKKKLEAKFKIIDGHVQLLGYKGDITENELSRLAKFHKVKPQIIKRRVDRWRKKHGSALQAHLNQLLIYEKPDEKRIEKIAAQFDTTSENVSAVIKSTLEERSSELDSYINIQVRKGFMAQKEISDLADIYVLEQGEILRHIRCPIKKDSDTDTDGAYQIDGTVIQFINENLNIVEQDSLYSFLGLFPGSTLEALQKKAIEKENDIRKIAQKDAFVTASGVLAGQCISIFKTDESRYAYDLSRARSLLRKLNHEIDLAANNDSIGIAYYHFLLRKAVSFGAIPSEAREHILAYCKSKGWKVEQPKKRINLKRYARVALITLAVLLISGSTFWYFYFSKQRLKEEYNQAVIEAGKQPSLEAQIRTFEAYLAQQDNNSELAERAQKNIASIRKRIAQRDFKDVTGTTEKLFADQQYEEINSIYQKFLSKHSDTAWAKSIHQKMAEIPALIDDRDYQKVKSIGINEPEKTAHAGNQYLRQHPEGTHVPQVMRIIKSVETPYYRNVVNALKQYEKNGDWNQSIKLCSRFIEVYRDSSSALKLKERRDRYQINLQNENILDSLTAQAGGQDATPQSLQGVYKSFLNNSPNSPAVPLIRNELAKINKLLGRQEAQKELNKLRQIFGSKTGRFKIKKRDTFFDSKSGLTWSSLDSALLTGQCMTYDEARAYVKGMKLGGYTDWRLPNAKELIGLFSTPSPFPGIISEWYWSSDRFKRYSGEWIILVDAVNPSSQPSIQKQDSNDCGWFRAVRP